MPERGPSPTPSQAQCSVCFRTFGGVRMFDRHRKGGQCTDPATLNARQDERGVWRDATPFPKEQFS